MQNLKVKIVTVILVICLISPAFLIPSEAHAQWIVYDPANFTVNTISAIGVSTNTFGKEFGLDTLAFMIANIILEQMAAATVNWINTGFNGSPAFVTDPNRYFGNVADGIAGQLIYNNPNLKFMCAPFRAQVQIAVSNAYTQPYGAAYYQCSLSQVIGNFDNFINDFGQGGWDGFIALSQNSQNNPIGLYSSWNNQMIQQVNSEVNQKTQELNWGQGFLTFRKCEARDQTGRCTSEGPVETPGSVIQDQLNNALHTGNDRLKVADEINEIISALLNQLISKAIGGLRSLSSPDPSNNNQVYTSQLNNGSSLDPNIQTIISNANQSVTGNNTTLSGIGSGPTGGLVPCQLPGGGIGVLDSSGKCVATSGGGGGGGGGGGFVPITATDGSIITGPPLDPDCALASFDDIVKRASAIFYSDQASYQAAGITIADLVENMDCGSNGSLP